MFAHVKNDFTEFHNLVINLVFEWFSRDKYHFIRRFNTPDKIWEKLIENDEKNFSMNMTKSSSVMSCVNDWIHKKEYCRVIFFSHKIVKNFSFNLLVISSIEYNSLNANRSLIYWRTLWRAFCAIDSGMAMEFSCQISGIYAIMAWIRVFGVSFFLFCKLAYAKFSRNRFGHWYWW